MCPLGFPSFPLAESEGFEPPVRRNAYTTFRVWLFRPLRQLSLAFGNKVAMVNTAYAPLTGDLMLSRSAWAPRPPSLFETKSQLVSPCSPQKLLQSFWGPHNGFFGALFRKRLQKYCFFLTCANFFAKKSLYPLKYQKKVVTLQRFL